MDVYVTSNTSDHLRDFKVTLKTRKKNNKIKPRSVIKCFGHLVAYIRLITNIAMNKH